MKYFLFCKINEVYVMMTGGPCPVVKSAYLKSQRLRVRNPVWPSSFKKTKCFFPAHSQRFKIVGSLLDREVAYSTSDRQGLNFKFCVWRAVSFHSSHHTREVILVQFSLHVHKGGLKPHSFHFISHDDLLYEFSYNLNSLIISY